MIYFNKKYPIPEGIEQKKLINYPDWIKKPQQIQSWLEQCRAKYATDKETSGYSSYYFTPAELVLEEIPDTICKWKKIKKRPFESDCDDWALMTAYLAHSALGLDAHYVHLFNALHTEGHAISYAIDSDNMVYVWDLWYYRGKYRSINDYVKENYPDKHITLDQPVMDRIKYLVSKGHVAFAN